ncbi:hypothetical protein QBC47DRAFT_417294 [Echria macrotheca]|uniref:Zn(2)-C6 fungal-type domain-containing protein n=1 Tax=Echria macrotheca TaxID=438768 RepID=A0AAJ0B523_9PEZI|nr:hypothetical protein QBC47DRAFT_417294 [Echria macrotheca]
MASSPLALNLRRNGTLQSCERCRKTKIKCDHSTPRCSRCVAKGLECVYEEAPMTRRFRAARFDVQSGRVRATTRAQEAETQAQADRDKQSDRPERPASRRSGPPTPQNIEITTLPVQPSGFVGPGSYRATLTAEDGQIARPGNLSDYSSSASPATGTTTHTIDRKRLDLGLQIIDFVLEHSVLLQNLMHHIYGVIRMPIVPHAVMLPATKSLFSTIRDQVPHDEDDDAKLRTVVRIFQSSYQPIQATRLTTVDQVCHLITGDNLRWETIGNILAMASLCLLHIQARDFSLLDPQGRSKQDLVQPFHGITDTLTTLTSVSPVVNELGVCLKYNQLLLALYRFGDSSQHLYSIFMELTSAIYASGMHQDTSPPGAPDDYPGFMHQWRRRCFTAVYSMDKTIATTLGRPPLIHRNYCVLDAPLDFDDDDLTGPALEHELRKLDQRGWNTDGRRRTTTYMRLRYLLATVREEVLELHLGVNNGVAPPGRAQLILQKLEQIWATCPDSVKYSPTVWTSSIRPHDIWFLIRFYLDYLYSMFLVFRFNARQDQSQESQQLLLSAAKDVLATVLVFNEHRELMREVRSDFSAVFLPYGLPCADVLAVELMYRPTSFSVGPGDGSRLVRAEVIRDLNLYVSCLSWMPGRGGNSNEFSREVQARLTQILDQIIDGTGGSPPVVTAELQDSTEVRLDVVANLNHQLFFDWDTNMYLDSQLDLFSQSLV